MRHIIFIMALFMAATGITAQEHDARLDSLIKALDLKEVVVTAKKIRQSGDTISYAASSYISKNDKTLEDLLKKMPGIEVKSDGQIVYNGQWIKEFYIEGLNMLGSNYGVATKNIDARDIGAVQVLEGHQDVKMLQGVERGSSPAINIRLKNKAMGVWTTILTGAAGAQPSFSWDASASVMNFRRSSQNISVYKTNNIGNDLRKEIKAPSTYTSSYGTGILSPGIPALSDKYAYHNTSHSVTVNQLYKLSKDATFAFNLNYLYDREKRDSRDETAYLTDSISRYVVSESNAANMHQHFVGANAVYKFNGINRYVKNNLSVKATFPTGEGMVSDKIFQKFSAHSVSVDDVLKLRYRRRGGGMADATFHVSFLDKRGLLTLPDDDFSQMVDQRSLTLDGSGSLLALKIPHFMFNLNAEVDATLQEASTGLDIGNESSPGDLRTGQIALGVNPKLLLHYGQRFQWLLYIPVGVRYYDSRDNVLDYDKTFLHLRPYSTISFKSSDRITFVFVASYGESLPSPLSLMVEKRFTNYRTTMSNPELVKATPNRTLKSSLTADYKDVLGMLFGSLSLTYVKTHDGTGSGYDISDGIVNYIRLPFSTDSRVWQMDQTFSKGFFSSNSKISESFSAGISRSEYPVNDVMRRGESRYLSASLSYNATFTGWLSFSTSNEFILSRSYTDGKPNGGAKHSFTNATSMAVWPTAHLNFSPSVMFYNNNYSTSGRNNVFLNCDIEYVIGDVILSVMCSNLLDNKVFRRFRDNGIVSYSNEYRLRGRTVMAGIRIRI